MITDLRKTPFPWFGGKADAAPIVWAALGDPAHYVEPFAGSLAVLMRRPHECNRTYYSETVNDIDGLLVNAWRAMQMLPRETADAASWPVSEADLHARHLAILRWKAERDLERLMADPTYCDPVIAGWWMWGCSSWIGSGWCSGKGAWVVGADGRITKRPKAGGVRRKIPHLGNDGKGVNRPQLREPGVAVQRPHLGDDGKGVNHAGTREPGVGVDDGREFHPMAMPELLRWFQFLSARLRHVRILNGDWRRSVTSGASKTLPVRQERGRGLCGVFLDPPYAETAERCSDLYANDSLTVAHDVREWCLANGPDLDYRIVLAGFEGEHGSALTDAGWTEVEWFRAGWLKGGMGIQAASGHSQARERLWLSPHCLSHERDQAPQLGLFGMAAAG